MSTPVDTADPVEWLPHALAGHEYYTVHDAQGDPPVLVVRVVGRCQNGSVGSIDFSASPPEIRSSVLTEALVELTPPPEVSWSATVRYGGCRPTVDPADIPVLPPGPDGVPTSTPADLARNPEPLGALPTTELVPPSHGE